MGEKGKVIAFEPIAINFIALQKNLELNQVPQAMAVNKALGNENKTMHVHINEYSVNPGAFNLMEVGLKNTFVDCVKGDAYLNQYHKSEKVDFIKIDVEGFELEVLNGLSETITQYQPAIVFEYDKDYQSKLNVDPQAIFSYFKDLNYKLFKIDGYGNRIQIKLSEQLLSAEMLAIPIED